MSCSKAELTLGFLDCALDHVLKNCIHEGKSAVVCPLCRGEFCIYDIQEVVLVADSVVRERVSLKEGRQRLERDIRAFNNVKSISDANAATVAKRE